MNRQILSAVALISFAPAVMANVVVWSADVNPYPTAQLDVSTSRANQVSGISTAIFDVNNGQYSFQGFCIEIEQEPWSSNPYNRTIIASSDPRFNYFSKLYQNHFASTKTSATAASAFGALLWEIQYDASNGLNLSGGEFRVNNAPADVLGVAAQMLASVTSATSLLGTWEFTVWDNPVDQALLEGKQVSNVPVPATAGLIGLGLLAFAKRRKVS